MAKFTVQFINGELSFGTPMREAKIRQWLKEHERAYFTLTLDDRESAKMRRFFEGAVVPYFYYQNPKSGWKNFEECREAIKMEFNFTFIPDRQGHPHKIAKSTAVSSHIFMEFLERLEHEFKEQGFEFPDSEAYNAWVDSAPPPGAIYPPLDKLAKKYHKEKGL